MGRKRKERQKLDPAWFEDIASVTTVPEVCRLFHVSRRTVLDAILYDRLAASQEGRIWLVSFNSALALWGNKNVIKGGK